MLDNKTILVTGSSRGIGEAIARKARAYGARVIVHGKTESPELKKITKELGAEVIYFDVANAEDTHQKLSSLGSIDILVNNAGINPSKTFKELSVKDWEEIFAVNVFGIANVTRAVLPHMKKGVIINIASIKALNSISGKSAYAASKAAVMRMTSSMAEEFAPNLRVNAIAPGFTETEMTAKSISPKIQAQIDRIPLKRMAKPEEIAEAVIFLASEKAHYITGQTLFVDGGYSVVG